VRRKLSGRPTVGDKKKNESLEEKYGRVVLKEGGMRGGETWAHYTLGCVLGEETKLRGIEASTYTSSEQDSEMLEKNQKKKDSASQGRAIPY